MSQKNFYQLNLVGPLGQAARERYKKGHQSVWKSLVSILGYPLDWSREDPPYKEALGEAILMVSAEAKEPLTEEEVIRQVDFNCFLAWTIKEGLIEQVGPELFQLPAECNKAEFVKRVKEHISTHGPAGEEAR